MNGMEASEVRQQTNRYTVSYTSGLSQTFIQFEENTTNMNYWIV